MFYASWTGAYPGIIADRCIDLFAVGEGQAEASPDDTVRVL